MRPRIVSLSFLHHGAARLRRAAAPLLLLAGLLGAPVGAQAARWEPVDPVELAATESTAFPGTDVEFLLSRHLMRETEQQKIGGGRMVVGEESLLTENYIRAKVYTQKGVGDLGKYAILFHTDRKVFDTAARVIKPDGTSRELKKSDIFESVRAKTRNEGEMKQVTFVFPDLEPGDVVEYRWTEQLGETLWLETFYCQEMFPVREYSFRVGGMRNNGKVGWMHCPTPETNDRNGFEVTFRNLPAFEEEENMPPMRELRGWVFVAKTFPHFPNDKAIWTELGRAWGDEFNLATRPAAALKKKAAELVAGATSDEEKLRRLYEFCQAEILNTTYRTTTELQAEIEKHKGEDAQSPAKTLEKGRGRADEINLLFGSLARALGYEARLVYNASRSNLLNVAIPSGWAFIYDMRSVAVKVGGQWQYHNPGNYLLPFGLLAAGAEGAAALICDTRKFEQGVIPVSRAEQNRQQRKGRFTLDAEGTLEGEVEETFLGHEATTFKADNWDKTAAEVTKNFRDALNRRLPNAEVSEIVWTNLEDRALPLVVRYRVRVPGYAEQMGQRLVFPPAFFEVGESVVFAAMERKFPIFFLYPWSEHDDIEIVLPEGYALDKPSAPQPVSDPAGPFGARYSLTYSGKTRTFGYQRDFALGGNGVFSFRAESYPVLKSLFEQLHKSDTHAIMLKPKEAAPVPTATAPASAQP